MKQMYCVIKNMDFASYNVHDVCNILPTGLFVSKGLDPDQARHFVGA